MSQEPNDTTSATFLKDIGDMKGDWIDAIWEPGVPNPKMLTHIVISEKANGVHIEGKSYTAENINGNTPLDPVGHFDSKHVAPLAGRDGFSYQYDGGEYRGSGQAKQHRGVGFYEFQKHPSKLHTFVGSFLVHEEKISRYVQGERISLGETGVLDNPSTRASLRKFLSEKSKAPQFEELDDQLQRHVGAEFWEFTANYQSKHAYSCAFLLRKMLERLLFLAFDENGKIDDIRRDRGMPNSRLKGLDDIIRQAKRTQVNGRPILQDTTAKKIQGAKFIGDVAAHHPTPFSVDMMDIDSSMAPLRVAYRELLAKIPNP